MQRVLLISIGLISSATTSLAATLLLPLFIQSDNLLVW